MASQSPRRRTPTTAPTLIRDLWERRASSAPYPPGDTDLSMARVRQFVSDPLSLLLDCYERFGPVFTLRLANSKAVFMLGPEANHYITVSHASNFTWSDSVLRDFSVVLGEGLFLTDGELHDRARRAMVPAFNRDHVAVSTEVMLAETERALDQLTPGSIVDVYGLTRQLTVRIVMRALLGIDPDAEQTRAAEVAAQLDQVEAFFGTFAMRMVRGPFTPWARLKRAMRELNALIDGEILRRRATGRRGEDILSMLLDATGEDGDVLSDAQIRDQVKTLIFAGQDSTTSTLALMLYELARHPEVAAKLAVEQQAQLGPGGPTSAQLASGELPFLEMVLDETLRRYAPPWLGPRRSLDSFEFGGHTIPARAHVAYSMWASHHLADVFEDPFEFRPERFAPEARAALPRGAFVPFGGGQRTCIGMRFAKVQIRTMATLLTSRFSLSLPDGFELQIGQIPTVSPTGGLPMLLGEPRS